MSEAYHQFDNQASVRPNSAATKQMRVLVPPYAWTLAILSSLFFIWGFAQVLNNTLLPHLRAAFDLSYTQATLIGSVWFIAYLTMSIPAAKLIKWIGFQRSMIAGLATMAFGALMMIGAVAVPSYPLVLLALFLLAAGVTVLQVAANPYVAVIGPAETASSRLNLVQAFNSMGSTLAPLFGGWLILSHSRSGMAEAGKAAVLSQAERLAAAHSVQLPYLLIALVLTALALLIARMRLPGIAVTSQAAPLRQRNSSVLRHRNLVLGVPAIFAYMVAEIGCAALFIDFVGQPDIADLAPSSAANYLFLLWGGMMAGRLAGGAFMRKVEPERILAGAGLLALLVLLVAALGSGSVAMWALISVGLFHSIMFPTIFALSIRGLGPLTEAGSGLLITAIGGGALVVVQGWLADRFGPQLSFLLPALCEAYILFFALRVFGAGSESGTKVVEATPSIDALPSG